MATFFVDDKCGKCAYYNRKKTDFSKEVASTVKIKAQPKKFRVNGCANRIECDGCHEKCENWFVSQLL